MVLEDELNGIVQRGLGECEVKKVLSAVRLLEKLGWLRRTMCPGTGSLRSGPLSNWRKTAEAGSRSRRPWALYKI